MDPDPRSQLYAWYAARGCSLSLSLLAAGSPLLWLVLPGEVKQEHPVRTSERGRQEARVPGTPQGRA